MTGAKVARGGRGRGSRSAAIPPIAEPDPAIRAVATVPDDARAAPAAPRTPILGATVPLPAAPPRIFAIPHYIPPAFLDRPSSPGEDFPSTPPGSDSEDDTVVNMGSQPKTRKPPPIIISPVKKKRAALGITRLTDLEVWDMPDDEIIRACIVFYLINHVNTLQLQRHP
jgi:hypothetical protein